MRMDSMSITLGNGRSITAKAGWFLTSQHQKQESEGSHITCINKSSMRASRCRWPLLVCNRRSPKEQVPGYLGVNGTRVIRSSVQIQFAITVGSEEKATQLAEESTDDLDKSSAGFSGEYFGKPVDKTELEALRVNTTRAKLIRKLSEANQYNRHLKRQIHEKEQTLNKCKNELALMEMELQALVVLAEETGRNDAKTMSRKINGKYIYSHLAVRLEELREKLLEQIKDVDAMRFHEVPLVWYGMAEFCEIALVWYGMAKDVKVMGSFDGWTYGEQMSPESSAGFTKFSTTLKLRPGRYEIKFLVDGEWQLSPDFQVVGEGLMENNLLIVE